MNFKYLLFLLLIPLFWNCSRPSEINESRNYTARYTEQALVIDGHLVEEQWQKASWSERFIDIEGSRKPTAHLQTNMKMLWDKHYLYVAKLEEPHVWATLNKRDEIIYRDNDFEVFIDPDGDGLNYYELEINAFGTVLDLFLKKPYNKKGKANILWDFTGLKTAVSVQGSINNPSDIDSFWIVEIAIPWASFSADDAFPPENGEEWRMNFSRVHWDLTIENNQYKKKELPEHNWVWAPQGKINMHIPEKWGKIKFDGRPDDELAHLPKFWIWTSADKSKSLKDWDSTFSLLKKAGIKGLLMSADTGVLQRVIPIAERYQLEVHAWFWTMNRVDAKPEWLSVNRLGKSLAEEKAYVNYYKFMCPAIPEVQSFIRSKMDELLNIKGLKGIHMDYIRYVDVILPIGLWDKYNLVQDHIMPEYDYGYHSYLRKLFETKYGYDPLIIDDVEHDSLWLDFRLNELNKTVFGLRDYVNSRGLNITAAVFPTPKMAKEMVRQDWGKWGLDYYFPMVYHNFYNEDLSWIRSVVEEDKEDVSPGAKIYCGLFLPSLKNEKDLTKAMQAAFEGGADGIAFFDLNALTADQLEQIENFK